MIDIKLIRENPQKVKKACRSKNVDPGVVDGVLLMDKKRRALLQEIEGLRKERNRLTKKDVKRGREIKTRLKKLEPKLKNAEKRLESALVEIPNPPADDVPLGKDEGGNVEIKKWGELPEFDFQPRDHFELGERLDLIDVKRAAKVAGTRFGYLKNGAVLLEFGLIKYAFDTLVAEGFRPVIPPVMIKTASMQAMGYLEHGGQEEMYLLPKDDLVLVGTSEQSIGPMHQDEVFAEKELPRRYVAFSTCFRREAGSYGKDTRGILRVHQFNKVEMFSFTKPENSDQEHEYLLSLEEHLMQGLEIHYRVMKICTGDLGAPAVRKYDIEAWFPAEKKYRETHSTSTCTDFQARRLNIKFKREKGGVELVHTLNGTAFSERPILAILENFQQADGSVLVPKVLQKYIGFKKIPAK